MAKRYTRRSVVAASGALLLAGCGPDSPAGGASGPANSGTFLANVASDGAPAPTSTPLPPTATPTRVPNPAGSEERTFLPGSPWESPLIIRHSGVAGPVVMVLGGVHGNEPGAWQAALDVASWQPVTGSLIVLPRANQLAINAFVRTFDDIGDLNRLYPGNRESALAMERMAAEITGVAREFGVSILWDMHESWQFYVDAPGTGTAALGQTVTAGVGPLNPSLAQQVVERVNPAITEREAFILREGRPFAAQTPGPGGTTRGRSSLAVGGFVPGLTPVLVEMGQQGQDVSRRVELHLAIAQAMLEHTGVL